MVLHQVRQFAFKPIALQLPNFVAGLVPSNALADLNRLFDACFRIQKEASIAAGRHIPIVVENVRGAIPWVGRSRWNFGSFHLWGDVPALMPTELKDGVKQGGDWFNASQPSMSRLYGSKSPQRKMASALIAKIPLTLSQHIAATYRPKAKRNADPT